MNYNDYNDFTIIIMVYYNDLLQWLLQLLIVITL
jgi:hypothetical protein